jgi:hypothetical protein
MEGNANTSDIVLQNPSKRNSIPQMKLRSHLRAGSESQRSFGKPTNIKVSQNGYEIRYANGDLSSCTEIGNLSKPVICILD